MNQSPYTLVLVFFFFFKNRYSFSFSIIYYPHGFILITKLTTLFT